MKKRMMRYVYEEECFHKEEKPLIAGKLYEEELIERKLEDVKKRVEYLDLRLPEGCTVNFQLGVENPQCYSARIEIAVSQLCSQGWNELIMKYGSTEKFIEKLLRLQRMRLERELKRVRNELSGFYSIDVMVQGKSKIHRVHGDFSDLRCDCMAYRTYKMCHHVELVKSLRKENLLGTIPEPIRAPPVFWKIGKGKSEFDREQYIILIPMEDEDPESTVRLLYRFGYGLEKMREMKVINRDFKFPHLERVLEKEVSTQEISA